MGNGRQRRPAPTATPYILSYRSWGSPKGGERPPETASTNSDPVHPLLQVLGVTKGWGTAARDGQHQQPPLTSSPTGLGGSPKGGERPPETASTNSHPLHPPLRVLGVTKGWGTAARDGQHQQRPPTFSHMGLGGHQRVKNGRQRRPAPTATIYILPYGSWGSPKGGERPPETASTNSDHLNPPLRVSESKIYKPRSRPLPSEPMSPVPILLSLIIIYYFTIKSRTFLCNPFQHCSTYEYMSIQV